MNSVYLSLMLMMFAANMFKIHTGISSQQKVYFITLRQLSYLMMDKALSLYALVTHFEWSPITVVYTHIITSIFSNNEDWPWQLRLQKVANVNAYSQKANHMSFLTLQTSPTSLCSILLILIGQRMLLHVLNPARPQKLRLQLMSVCD